MYIKHIRTRPCTGFASLDRTGARIVALHIYGQFLLRGGRSRRASRSLTFGRTGRLWKRSPCPGRRDLLAGATINSRARAHAKRSCQRGFRSVPNEYDHVRGYLQNGRTTCIRRALRSTVRGRGERRRRFPSRSRRRPFLGKKTRFIRICVACRRHVSCSGLTWPDEMTREKTTSVYSVKRLAYPRLARKPPGYGGVTSTPRET